MKKNYSLFLLVGIVTISLSACSSSLSGQKNVNQNVVNQGETRQSEANQNEIPKQNSNEEEPPQFMGEEVSPSSASSVVASNLNSYSNKNLGISFNYPKEWPAPVFIKTASYDGSNFDADNQWEIKLGNLQKNSLEGVDKYFASIRGFYAQSESDILKEIKKGETEKSMKLIEQYKTNNYSFVVYSETGINDVRNILIFGKNNKAIKLQSIGGTLDSVIDSIAKNIVF